MYIPAFDIVGGEYVHAALVRRTAFFSRAAASCAVEHGLRASARSGRGISFGEHEHTTSACIVLILWTVNGAVRVKNLVLFVFCSIWRFCDGVQLFEYRTLH